MKLLCSSSSFAFVHSLRIALEGEGIANYCSDSDSALSSFGGPMTGIAARIYVLKEQDWVRAVEIFNGLSAPSVPVGASVESRKISSRWIMISSGVLLGIIIAVIIGDSR